MNTLEEFKAEWKKDTVINQLDLSRESLKSASIHSKYIDLLVDSKRRVSRKGHDLARMHQFKKKYWAGHLTKEELIEYGLPQYQLTAPLKSQTDSMLEADEDCIKIKEEVEELELIVFFLENVMKSIYSRSFDIKNSIDFSRFQAGN